MSKDNFIWNDLEIEIRRRLKKIIFPKIASDFILLDGFFELSGKKEIYDGADPCENADFKVPMVCVVEKESSEVHFYSLKGLLEENK